jgi:hypothetical protein
VSVRIGAPGVDVDELMRQVRETIAEKKRAPHRAALRPVQKLFWNPTPMISALSRQSDLNATYVHLLHNLSLAVTRQSLEIHDLKNRLLQLQGRLDLQARREKALEALLPAREGSDGEGGAAG